MPTIKEILQNNINRIAETQFAIRPLLVNRLKSQHLTEYGKEITGGHDNFHDLWIASLNDKFFDMGTFIRLGSAIEDNLKAYYMNKKGYANNLDLIADAKYKENIFQRVQPWQQDDALSLYKDELGFDLTTIPELIKVQEIVNDRHLFAHSSGLLNNKYIKNLKRINGTDLLSNPSITKHYPMEDIYWFEPLNGLATFIEDSRRFFRSFPE
jgi:hypothetical protein